MLGLIPCAGSASRLSNLPKFMLPLHTGKGCLLSRWVDMLKEKNCDKIIIAVSPTTELFVNHLELKDVIIKNVGFTATMNETIVLALTQEHYDTCIMVMPDTFVEDLPVIYTPLLGGVIVGAWLWNIRETQKGKIGQCKVSGNTIVDIIDKDETCNYPYGWGAMIWRRDFEKYISVTDSHPGYSMKKYLDTQEIIQYVIVNGSYYDCGTVEGYKEYLTSF